MDKKIIVIAVTKEKIIVTVILTILIISISHSILNSVLPRELWGNFEQCNIRGIL